MNEAVGKWTASRMEHALKFWRAVYRGDSASQAMTKLHSDADIANANLILWGDPSSNRRTRRRSPPKLLISSGTAAGLKVGAQTLPVGDSRAPIFIFPNPLNPEKYVVINSSLTYRELALLNNSDQTPKLPDWAIVDLRTPPTA